MDKLNDTEGQILTSILLSLMDAVISNPAKTEILYRISTTFEDSEYLHCKSLGDPESDYAKELTKCAKFICDEIIILRDKLGRSPRVVEMHEFAVRLINSEDKYLRFLGEECLKPNIMRKCHDLSCKLCRKDTYAK